MRCIAGCGLPHPPSYSTCLSNSKSSPQLNFGWSAYVRPRHPSPQLPGSVGLSRRRSRLAFRTTVPSAPTNGLRFLQDSMLSDPQVLAAVASPWLLSFHNRSIKRGCFHGGLWGIFFLAHRYRLLVKSGMTPSCHRR